MTASAELTARLEELEIRLSFQDENLEALQRQNQAQQQEIEHLQEQVARLNDRLKAITPSPLEADTGPRHELPPHY